MVPICILGVSSKDVPIPPPRMPWGTPALDGAIALPLTDLQRLKVKNNVF